ncbi:hypothetical protein BH20ACT23_BH20ACT23_29760 [soil metagenome]
MLPPDDRRLEDIIGSLQSEMGVPQNPQEYRLTVKVAEERDTNHRTHKSSEKNGNGESNGRPKREKAPAPPRVGAGEGPTAEREEAPSRKRRSRRRRRGGRKRGASGGGNAPQA